MFGATGSGDEAIKLQAALDAAAATGRPLLVDRDYSFATKLSISNALTLVGNRSARLIWTGRGDAIEITAAVTIDGVVVDGNENPNTFAGLARSDIPPKGALVGIHGEMDSSGMPAYLPGVRIKWLRCQNYDGRAAFAGFNLSDGRIDHLECDNSTGNGIHVAGLFAMRFGKLAATRCGNLAAHSSRLGSGVAFFRETAAGKEPADWVDVDGYLSTDGVTIGEIEVVQTTDTGVYFHDYLSGTEPELGLKNVSAESIRADLTGHDAVKCRLGARDIHIGRLVATRTANRSFVATEYSHRIVVDELYANECGFDAIGEIAGTPVPYTGGRGIGESLQTNPNGFEVNNCNGVDVLRATIRNVSPRPSDKNGGHGVRLVKCTGFTGDWDVRNCYGNILRLSAIEDFDIVCTGQNAGIGNCEVQAADVYINSDGFGNSQNGRIAYKGLTPTISPNSAFPVRINDASTNIRLRIDADGSQWQAGNGEVFRNGTTGTILVEASPHQ
jgi:hypothetical protein